MARKFKVEIVTPEKLVFSEEIESLVIPAERGYLGVLAGHAPLLATLQPGEITIKGSPKGDLHFATSGGFMEVTPGKAVLLTESAEEVTQIDVPRAEESKKRQEEAALREETRRTRALLATYTSETDIESARKRALEDNEKAVKEVETRVAAIKTRQAQLAGELEFYKGKNKPPPKLEQDVKNAEIDLQAQQSLLDAKKKDVNTINAKYDEDKRRYLELTGGGAKKK